MARAPRKYDPVKRRAAYLRSKERALKEGFKNVRERASYNRQFGSPYGIAARTVALAAHGVTLTEFNRMRRENLAHTPEGTRHDGRPRTDTLAAAIQQYRVDVGEDARNWSDARVGYVVSYNRAVVNPETNFYAPEGIERLKNPAETFYDPDHPKPVPVKVRRWTETQFLYLVRYGGFESIEEFDDRYGDSGPISQFILKNLR